MKLLLTSNGITTPELEEAFSELAGGRSDLKVAIIPTAGEPIEWIPDKGDSKKFTAKLVKEKLEGHRKWLEKYSKTYIEKGYEVVIVDLKADPKEVKEKLQNVDAIDVIGGDANYLLDWAKVTKLDTYLKDLLDKGVVYIGTSAGCGLLVNDIGLTWWEPEQWAGTDHIGFGIVDFVVVAHQKESDNQKTTKNLIRRKKYMQSLGNFPWKVYLLQDGQAIKVNGGKVEHIGPGIKRFI